MLSFRRGCLARFRGCRVQGSECPARAMARQIVIVTPSTPRTYCVFAFGVWGIRVWSRLASNGLLSKGRLAGGGVTASFPGESNSSPGHWSRWQKFRRQGCNSLWKIAFIWPNEMNSRGCKKRLTLYDPHKRLRVCQPRIYGVTWPTIAEF